MTYVVPRKGRLYRISGELIAEDGGAFIYPTDIFSTNFWYPDRIKLDNSPYFILDVDCILEFDSIVDDSANKRHEYIRGIVQGYNGICYLSSYNSHWLKPF